MFTLIRVRSAHAYYAIFWCAQLFIGRTAACSAESYYTAGGVEFASIRIELAVFFFA